MRVHFVKTRLVWYIISLLIIVPGLVSLVWQGLNLGIDFTGGTLLELEYKQVPAIEQVRAALKEKGLGNAGIQAAEGNRILIRTVALAEKDRDEVLKAIREKTGDFNLRREDKVGPVIGKELLRNALLALGIAIVLMIIYISWRFEFWSGLSAIAALLHDVLVVIGVFSLLQLEVDSAFVAAILTIIGYSINDTIVIFDRIRENLLKRRKDQEVEDVINSSIYQTFGRTINTVLTVVFVLVALLVFGGETIYNFVLAMLIGVLSGTYSSICTASPLWFDLRRYAKKA
ncbi:protein translocase subunit secF [Carboxydocella sporoproducens DSM 16521]|uniref:Protein-export membrane protein SecF n=2 Tax=Carboxydocella TaxID=178898 RepID=A0A1T4PIL2_9FIRM|nr:protein translocase subunit secF [Carboxydocella thermautotrophica]AVX31950.1 protein translocase subunit secF [Carboxydocella thermautotrophica]GAW32595.1 protein translocase subunit SecF [Carboxydocella sp. JDF658]SJZ90678.1 protein translocase subunit secF [Carboxydocella sporoproducens DSM 16521]